MPEEQAENPRTEESSPGSGTEKETARNRRVPPEPGTPGWAVAVLAILYVLLVGFVFADVWLGIRPPYVYDIETESLSYPEWLDQQAPLKWFWAGRPVWDAPVWVRALWMVGVLALLVAKGPTERMRAKLVAWRRMPFAGDVDHTPPAGSAASFAPARASSRIPLWLILVFAALVLWIFRSQDLRYGDSEFLTRLVPREVASVGANIAYEEILDCTIHCRAFYHLNRWFGWDIVKVFNIIGIAATLIGLSLVWPLWGRRAGLPAGLILTLWFATGWSQLFFGHVEYYTLVAVVLLLYTALAADLLEGGGTRFWLCAFVAGLAVCFHLLAGWIWPTLAVLFWVEWKRGRTSAGKMLLWGIPAFLLPIALSVAIATYYGFPPARFGDTHFAHMKFLFLLNPETAESHRAIYQYPFLSPRHVWDAVNELVRAAWPGVVLVAGLSGAAIHEGLWRRPTVVFWIVAAVGFQIFGLVWNPDLGYHRDWDLFAVVALGWTGLGIEWLRTLNHDPWGILTARVLLFALSTAIPMRILQLLHHSWWVGPVNHAGMF